MVIPSSQSVAHWLKVWRIRDFGLLPRIWHHIEETFSEFIESVFIEIPNDVFRMGKNIIVLVIYRPPGTDVNECSILLNGIL